MVLVVIFLIYDFSLFVPIFDLVHAVDAILFPFKQLRASGGGGVGGGLLQKFYDGVCGPNLEDTPYSYKGQARKPYLFV